MDPTAVTMVAVEATVESLVTAGFLNLSWKRSTSTSTLPCMVTTSHPPKMSSKEGNGKDCRYRSGKI